MNRGFTLLDPFIREMNATVPDPMKWFRLEEDMLLLGLGERVAAAVVREAMQPEMGIDMRFLHAKWRREMENGHQDERQMDMGNGG